MRLAGTSAPTFGDVEDELRRALHHRRQQLAPRAQPSRLVTGRPERLLEGDHGGLGVVLLERVVGERLAPPREPDQRLDLGLQIVGDAHLELPGG